MSTFTKEDALKYHAEGKPGKIEVIPTTPYSTQNDLSLAYSPGVAEPCREIQKNPEDAYKYTAKANLVAVISNGTAVLGLGDIGAQAGKPVMEGKGLLFKIFADIDVFDIEIDEKDVDAFVETVKRISPTFGGINLEDIKAPECFDIERKLKDELSIPVMHDDQHGTAIISSAGLINALELTNRKIENIKLVVSGAGASAIACTRLIVALGAKKENIFMIDSKGVINKKRKDLNKYKKEFINDTEFDTLQEVIKGADVFFGLSVGGILTQDMVRSMADTPIVFALANPTPEITYEKAQEARKDIIIATGRSDYPNQVNNVLGFPYIFRGALDVKATAINEEMKKAAVYALAALAKEDVPEDVAKAYNIHDLTFGPEYIIPKPLDLRLVTTVSPAIAKAAIESGVAKIKIQDWDAYRDELAKRLGIENKLIRSINARARREPMRVVYPEADNYKILKAAHTVFHDGTAKPILLGNKEKIKAKIQKYNFDFDSVQIIDINSPEYKPKRKRYANVLWKKRQRKGLTYDEAYNLIHQRIYFGIMMVETGDADALITGISNKYSDTIRPALQITGTQKGIDTIAGMYVVMTKKGPFFFADTTVNVKHDTETLVQTALLAAEEVKRFNIEPVIAMLSYSNFGSVAKAADPLKVKKAVEILHKKHPELIVDGEIQANFAFNKEMRKRKFPFSKLAEKNVNTLIFPDLASGNIAYKMMQEIGDAEVIGPILMGINKSIHIVPIDCSVREIVSMTSIAVLNAQCIKYGEYLK